jgi:hypothetical protein
MFRLMFLVAKVLFGVFHMPNFESFVARHGEFAVQSLIERIERYDGVRSAAGISLEERWKAVMTSHFSADRPMAA